MNKTSIDYLTHTWNPLVMKCTKVSPACDHCWHLAMARRLAVNPLLSNDEQAAYAGEIPPLLVEDRLAEPLRRKKPSVIGVQFMGDLFHEDVPDEFIGDVWQIMQRCPQHTFQVLTKRPARMLRWLVDYWNPAPNELQNIWLGVTAENQQTADERIPLLLQIPAAVRFVSCEPLLSKINLLPHLPRHGPDESFFRRADDFFTDGRGRNFLDWVIAGGETGPGARPMHPDWARSLRDQCQVAGVPFFFKGWGAWSADVQGHSGGVRNHGHFCADGKWINRSEHRDSEVHMCRVGKKRAGRLLDGVQYDEMPEVTR